MRVADEHGYSQGVAKAHEGGGKVTALGKSHPASVPVQSDGGREAMFSESLCASLQSRFCCKIGAHMVRHQDRGAFVDDSERFHHMLLFAVRIEPRPVEASDVHRVANAASVGDVRSDREKWGDERQCVRFRARAGE
jgi:hypothetical protein